VPYAHGFEGDPTLAINSGDEISLELVNDKVKLNVISRSSED
jgi:hypothetical protein